MFSFLYPGAMAMRAMITDQPVKNAPRQEAPSKTWGMESFNKALISFNPPKTVLLPK